MINKRLNGRECVLLTALVLMLVVIVLPIYFSQYIPLVWKIVCYVVFPALVTAALLFWFFGFTKTYKSLFLVVTFAAVLALILVILEQTGFMNIFHVPADCADVKACISENMRVYLQSTGKWSTIFYVFLQFLQTLVLPIPSFILTGGGNMLYSQAYGNAIGPIVNACYSLIGVWLGSVIAFYIGRKFGIKLVVWIVGTEALKKTLKMLQGKDTLVLTIMFILPFFPDDILCFVAGLSSMGTVYFIVMMTVSRVIVLFSSSYLLNILPLTTWWGLLSWGAMILVVFFAFYFAMKKGDKIMRYLQRKFFKKHRATSDEFDRLSKLVEKLSENRK